MTLLTDRAARAGALALSLVFAGAPAAVAATINAPAPAFHGTGAAGEAVDLSMFAGKMVVLEWTNHLCPYVQKHYNSGNMQALQADAEAKDIVWLSVISSAPGKQGHVSPEEALAIADETGAAPKHILIDETGDIGRAYGATATPHMFVIAGDGSLKYQGAIDDQPSAQASTIEIAQNYVRAAVASLMGGDPVEVAETAAYGCSVKY